MKFHIQTLFEIQALTNHFFDKMAEHLNYTSLIQIIYLLDHCYVCDKDRLFSV